MAQRLKQPPKQYVALWETLVDAMLAEGGPGWELRVPEGRSAGVLTMGERMLVLRPVRDDRGDRPRHRSA